MNKRNATLIQVTRNKIKNKLKTCKIAACKLERECKKQVELLQKAKEFVLLKLLKPLLNPELSITKTDIKLQLCKRLVSNPAVLGLEIDSILRRTQTTGSPSNRRVLGINKVGDDFTVQSDYISFSGLGNEDSIK
jgi:hypothetical protein